MANYIAQYRHPSLIDYERLGTNGQQANSPMLQRIAEGMNHITGHRRKVFATVPFDPKNPFVFDTGTKASPQSMMSGVFRTGPATKTIRVRIGILGPVGDFVALAEPAIWLRLDGTDNTEKVYDNSRLVGGATEANPDHVGHAMIRHGVDPDTTYEWVVQGQDDARMIYLCIFEEPQTILPATAEGVVNPAVFISGGPILESHALQLAEANNAVIEKSGAALLQHNNEEEPSTTLASYVNVWTGGSTFQTLDTQSRAPRSREINCTFAVDGAIAGAGSGGCQLIDTASTVLSEITTFTSTRDVKYSNFTMPAFADQEVKVQIKGDGTNLFTLYGYSLYMSAP